MFSEVFKSSQVMRIFLSCLTLTVLVVSASKSNFERQKMLRKHGMNGNSTVLNSTMLREIGKLSDLQICVRLLDNCKKKFRSYKLTLKNVESYCIQQKGLDSTCFTVKSQSGSLSRCNVVARNLLKTAKNLPIVKNYAVAILKAYGIQKCVCTFKNATTATSEKYFRKVMDQCFENMYKFYRTSRNKIRVKRYDGGEDLDDWITIEPTSTTRFNPRKEAINACNNIAQPIHVVIFIAFFTIFAFCCC